MLKRPKQSLLTHNLTPKKRFGQNFLVNRHTAEAIVYAGQVCKEDKIVEVGVGLGALTIPLANAVDHVFGLEIDSGIIRFHQDESDLPGNVTLIHADVLKADFNDLAERCGGKLKIMANLPYSISNPFLFKLIDNHECVDWATIMLQKEVAERLAAPPKSKDYGVPTVLLQSCASVKTLMTLKPQEFHPRPKIDSVVVRLDFTPNERIAKLPRYDYALFRQIVRAAFGQRRKTLLNTLSTAGVFRENPDADKSAIKALAAKVIESAGLSVAARAEELMLEDFVRLAVETDDCLNGRRQSA